MSAVLKGAALRDMTNNKSAPGDDPREVTVKSLTPEQREAVETLGKDLCVSAGAGSGKTGVLIERFVNLVVQEGLSVSEILCITFTDKAAGEMKERIAQRFLSLGMEWQRQEVEFAYISTIDSFCSRLLRENALEAGLDPDFDILKEYEAAFLQRSLSENLLTKWEETNPEGYNLLLEELHCRDLAESSVRLLNSIRSAGFHPKDIPALYQNGTGPAQNNTLSSLNTTLKNISTCVKEIEDLASALPVGSQQRNNVEELLVRLEPIRNVRTEDLTHENIVNLPDKYIKLTVKSPTLKENLKELKLLLENLRQTYWERETEKTRQALKEFLTQLLQVYGEEKLKRRVLDFSDLIEKATGLLQTFPSLRAELRGKFKHILVDEFQDTNNLQRTLLELLKSEGNLFVVGDAQQSIYGFRDADLEVFLEHKRQTHEWGGKIIHLDRNFRSRPEIISFVNQVFRNYWDRDGALVVSAANLSVDWRPLVAGASFAPRESPSIELLLTKGKDMEEARNLEAHLLARRIKEIVENGELKITRLNHHRPVAYGDFAVLFRSTTDIKLFEGALEEMGIPFFVLGGKGLYDAREIVDLINLLQLIDNPLDEVRLAAVLRSPLVGINDHTLFWLSHRTNNNKKDFLWFQLHRLTSIPEIDPIQRERLLRFRELLERLRELKERLSIAALIENILAETHYDSRVLAFPDGRQSHANLRKFTELARDFEKSGILGLSQFLKVIRDIRVTETRESEAPTDLERDDVVKILTIHKAKGLEFPVVALADTGRGSRSHHPDVLFSKKGGLGLQIINPLTKKPETTATFEAIAQEIKEREAKEEERVLYVALTRAQEHLILSGSFTERSKSEPLKRIAETLGISLDSAALPDEITFGEEGHKLRLSMEKGPALVAIPLSVRLSSEEREKIIRGEPLPLPVIVRGEAPKQSRSYDSKKPLPIAMPIPRQASLKDYIYSVTEIMNCHRCPRLYYFRYKLGLPGLGPEEPLLSNRTEDELEGSPWARLGNAAHKVLELYRPDGDSAHGLEKLILQALEETLPLTPQPAPKEHVDTLKGWVQNFYSSREGQMVKTSGEVRREMPFLFNYGGTPVRGKIDLLFSPNGKDWNLLDFKTSSSESEALKSYEIQMRLYSLSVRALFGKLPERAILFFLPEGKTTEVDIAPETMRELDEWMKDFFTKEEAPRGTNAFPAQRKQNCRWCEYSKYCREGE